MAESPKPERFKDWLALKTVDHFLRGTQEVGYDTRANSGSRLERQETNCVERDVFIRAGYSQYGNARMIRVSDSPVKYY